MQAPINRRGFFATLAALAIGRPRSKGWWCKLQKMKAGPTPGVFVADGPSRWTWVTPFFWKRNQ